MKKVLSVLLALVLALSCVSVAAAAEEKVTPLIIVPGYSASELYLDYGEETEEHIWGVQMKPIIDKVLQRLGALGISLGALGVGDKELLIKTVGDAVRELYGVLANNDDGTSKYNVTAALTDPATTTTKYFVDKYGEDSGMLHLPEINCHFASQIGGENIFNAHIDFRQGAIKCAQDLRKYVEAVKEYTGSDKVSLYGLSHGGMTVGVYLSLYGDLGDIESAVMFHPALRGAYFLNDIISRNLDIDFHTVVEYAQVGAFTETEYEFLMVISRLGLVNDLANALVDEVFDDIAGNWGSIWDFMPPEFYEKYKEMYLDPVANAKIIEASDKMHYEIMPNYSEAFKNAQAHGARVSVISGTGRPIITGGQVNSDGILACYSTSGSVCAPLGQRFADGYKKSGSNCVDPTHNHVSPSMEVDASYAYLPENTWFVEGQLHGQVWWDDYTKELCSKLLFSDEIEDVYSSEKFPQFEYSQNPKDEIHISFDNAPVGFLSQGSKGVYITNLSKEYAIKVLGLTAKRSKLYFDTLTQSVIKAGETVYLPLKGEIPNLNAAKDELTVSYLQLGSVSAPGTRTFDFTITGGEDVSFDAKNPYCDANLADPFDDHIDGTNVDKIFEFFGIKAFISSIYNWIMTYLKPIFDLIGKIRG
ncbi:MAG: hypothetical protein Q4D20_00180 [Clostridia bacterium]|nr:hypothetical protein [Clostridia bacterium]